MILKESKIISQSNSWKLKEQKQNILVLFVILCFLILWEY